MKELYRSFKNQKEELSPWDDLIKIMVALLLGNIIIISMIGLFLFLNS